MGNDLRLSLGWKKHPKIKKLKKILGAEGILSLLSRWTFAADYKTKGPPA